MPLNLPPRNGMYSKHVETHIWQDEGDTSFCPCRMDCRSNRPPLPCRTQASPRRARWRYWWSVLQYALRSGPHRGQSFLKVGNYLRKLQKQNANIIKIQSQHRRLNTPDSFKMIVLPKLNWLQQKELNQWNQESMSQQSIAFAIGDPLIQETKFVTDHGRKTENDFLWEVIKFSLLHHPHLVVILSLLGGWINLRQLLKDLLHLLWR